jgi:SAM-dependent methyltransferase
LELVDPEVNAAPGPTYEARKKRELDFYSTGEVRRLPAVYGYWAKRYLRPKLESVGIASLKRFYVDTVAGLCRANAGALTEIVSVGAGNCKNEIRLAGELRAMGVENFRIDCLDISPHMLERGREEAQKHDLLARLGFVETDIKEWDVTQGTYTACLAIQSLHHFVELEAVFAKVRQAIAPGGWFVVHDMIGRNGHMRWPEALRYIEEIWDQMPDRYKYNHQLKCFDAEYVNRDWSRHSFEGIRAQDILPLLLEFFYFEVFVGFGNVIDPFISRAFGPNLKPRRQDDRDFIDKVARLDDRLIDEGTVKPTHLIGILRTEPVAEMKYYGARTPQHCLRPPEAGADALERSAPEADGSVTSA